MGNAQAKKQQAQKLKKEQQKKQLEELEQKEKLIGTAVLFLEGEKVQQVPETQRRIFLRKKGLTDEMIEEAYKRLRQKKEDNTATSAEKIPNIEQKSGDKKAK